MITRVMILASMVMGLFVVSACSNTESVAEDPDADTSEDSGVESDADDEQSLDSDVPDSGPEDAGPDADTDADLDVEPDASDADVDRFDGDADSPSDADVDTTVDADPDVVTDADIDTPPTYPDFAGPCDFDSDCSSRVCFDWHDYNDWCYGRACSAECIDDAQCQRYATSVGAPDPSTASCITDRSGSRRICHIAAIGLGTWACE